MSSRPTTARPFDLGALLRGDEEVITGWITRWTTRLLWRQMVVIAVGAGAFGAAMGSWRAPEQAVWSAVKLPFVLLATAALRPLVGMANTMLPEEKKFFVGHWLDWMATRR